MSFLDFDYELKLTFSSPVADHRFILRCLPLCDLSQLPDGVKAEIFPHSVLWRGSGNESGTLMGSVGFEHTEFTAHTHGRVFEREGYDVTPPHLAFLHFTSVTEPDEVLRETAKIWESRKRNYELALEVMERVNSLLVYTENATDSDTTAVEALQMKKGVCQDYAHIYCSLMRLLGVPTRYVAGLLQGVGETHAWNECYIDGHWRAFDCTNNKPATNGYVKLAVGVDARQCALNRGVFTPLYEGSAKQTQSVRALVETS